MAKNQVGFDLVDLKIGRIEKCPEQIIVCSGDIEHEGKKKGGIFSTNHYRKMNRLFREWDTDCDGFLQIADLNNMIKTEERHHIKAHIVRLLKKYDKNEDGQLNFEEFYQLSKDRTWIIRQMVKSYCQLVVAPRKKRYRFQIYATRSMCSPCGSMKCFMEPSVYPDGYEEQMSFWPPTLTMITFSILEILSFLYDVYATQDGTGGFGNGPAAKSLKFYSSQKNQIWRFVTYMFVHGDRMHLIMNVIVQIFLGVALELVHDWWRITLVYLSGVIAGSLGTSIISPDRNLIGASGGVYALITAHIAAVILNWSEMDYPGVVLTVFLGFSAFDTVMPFIIQNNANIGYAAHLCGGIAGLLVGIGALQCLEPKSWTYKLWIVAVTLYGILMLSGIAFIVFFH